MNNIAVIAPDSNEGHSYRTEGQEAFFDGVLTCECPYKYGSNAMRAWVRGWLDAMEACDEWRDSVAKLNAPVMRGAA